MKFAAAAKNHYAIACDCLVEFVNKNGMSTVDESQPKGVQDSIALLRQNGDLTDNTAAKLVHTAGQSKAKRVLVVPVDFEVTKKSPAHAASMHIHNLANTIVKALANTPVANLCIQFDHRYMQSKPGFQSDAQLDARIFVAAFLNAAYSSNTHKGKDKQTADARKEKQHPKISQVTLLTHDSVLKNVMTGIAQGQAVGEGMILARQLGDAPPNICHPLYLTAQAKKLAKTSIKLSVKVLGEKELEKLGAGAFLAVTQGSIHPPQLILMEYNGGKAGQAPIVLVGKGLTFDSGGISLKPGANMDEMKYDMCGAASVMGTMQAIAELNLPINVVGAVAAAENMPSANATRPGDIVTTMSGQTVEILNTDAEGRLVLCDTLTYIKKYNPKVIIDVATLTGACIIALGTQTSAVMSNDDELSQQLQSLSLEINDPCWPLPLWPVYAEDLKSNFADLPNIGSGKGAGSIVAGAFLQKFVDADTPWAHLDIAGTAWKTGGSKGATGRPVHLLVSYLINQLSSPTVADPSLAQPSKNTARSKTKPAKKAGSKKA